MTKEQIDQLILKGRFPANTGKPNLVETHISWVLLCDRLVYKIKRPIQYSFLDFSTLEKRQYYCRREVELNRRLTENIYLGVQPVRELHGQFYMGGAIRCNYRLCCEHAKNRQFPANGCTIIE